MGVAEVATVYSSKHLCSNAISLSQQLAKLLVAAKKMLTGALVLCSPALFCSALRLCCALLCSA
jgi:hypothetical protein